MSLVSSGIALSGMGDNTGMEWLRRNMTSIGILVVIAMAMPFVLVLFGIVVF